MTSGDFKMELLGGLLSDSVFESSLWARECLGQYFYKCNWYFCKVLIEILYTSVEQLEWNIDSRFKYKLVHMLSECVWW